MSDLPEDPNEFATIEQYWHFDRLCQDLAEYKDKGRPLSPREIKLLQCLLLGYEPKEISQISNGSDGNANSASVRATLSEYLYPLITDLIHEKAQREVGAKGARMLIWLERFGYRKALMYPPKSFDRNSRLPQFEPDRV